MIGEFYSCLSCAYACDQFFFFFVWEGVGNGRRKKCMHYIIEWVFG